MQFTSSLQRESAITNRRIAADLATFREAGETCWFDGTPHSIDRRLAACNALLTRAQAAAARAPFDPKPLEILAELGEDRRALAGLRADLLDGGANRVVQAFYPPEPPQHINEDLKPQWREDVANGVNPMERHLPEKYRRTAAPNAYSAPRQDVPKWDSGADDWATNSLGYDMTGGGSHYNPGPSTPSYHQQDSGGSQPYQAPSSPAPVDPHQTWMDEYPNTTQPMPDAVKYDANGVPPWHPSHDKSTRGQWPGAQQYMDVMKRTQSRLAADERRWVALEAPKFVRANLDCIYFPSDDPMMHIACALDEMAIRAQHHVARELSASTNKNAITEAFVGEVLRTARQLPAPQPVKQAARGDFDGLPDEAMWL